MERREIEMIEVSVRKENQVDFRQSGDGQGRRYQRFSPNVTGPIPMPQRSPKMGSVRMVKPSSCSNTVLCPNQAAWTPFEPHRRQFGTADGGVIGRLRSREYCCQKAGAPR